MKCLVHYMGRNVRKLQYFPDSDDKGADQTAQMWRLVCTCVVHKPQRYVFLQGPYCFIYSSLIA